ncbi:MAG: hypothetical protein NC820_00255 [Candidatus Omnitrophica bacterium]|nr:hypothetical protein [Candidatus Omnitrophota bacterium]
MNLEETKVDTQIDSKLIDLFCSVVDVETLTHKCCTHLSTLVANGRVRNRLLRCAKYASRNKELILKYLSSQRFVYVCKEKCEFCKIKPESFSILGAIKSTKRY